MKDRLTYKGNDHVCKIAECNVEEWMFELYGSYTEKDFCKNCPFEKYIKHLAELEDEKELYEDDLK